MILEDVPVGRALGTVLAHSRRLGSGDVLKKGRVLTDADCARLSAAGVVRVTVARLEPGDVGEDEAAGRVAAAAAGPHVLVARPATGRSNLFASARGLLVVSRPHVD
ncbi:MAG TPA: hypothetical protein VE987_02825, partial [Polyangiaceae bacterium]|nr:hypothetical protein [Polyangiaceae bacterium]